MITIEPRTLRKGESREGEGDVIRVDEHGTLGARKHYCAGVRTGLSTWRSEDDLHTRCVRKCESKGACEPGELWSRVDNSALETEKNKGEMNRNLFLELCMPVILSTLG